MGILSLKLASWRSTARDPQRSVGFMQSGHSMLPSQSAPDGASYAKRRVSPLLVTEGSIRLPSGRNHPRPLSDRDGLFLDYKVHGQSQLRGCRALSFITL